MDGSEMVLTLFTKFDEGKWKYLFIPIDLQAPAGNQTLEHSSKIVSQTVREQVFVVPDNAGVRLATFAYQEEQRVSAA